MTGFAFFAPHQEHPHLSKPILFPGTPTKLSTIDDSIKNRVSCAG